MKGTHLATFDSRGVIPDTQDGEIASWYCLQSHT